MSEQHNLLCQICDLIDIVDTEELKVNFTDSIFELVAKFIKSCREEPYYEVAINGSENIPSLKIGTLLGIAIWSTEDNGAEQAKATRSWIIGNDKRKIEVALSIAESYPLVDMNRLVSRLDDIEIEYPELAYLCKFWRNQAEIEIKHQLKREICAKESTMFGRIRKLFS